ncbi:MAG: ABC transporter permease [Rickettsiales bacterium]|nr:ABC transporter permease [Rickettsiales bacterium]
MKLLNFSKIKALIIKELIVLLQDPKSRFSLIMPPLIQLLLFSSVATLDVFNIKLAVLNYDNGNYSTEIVRDIVASKSYFTNIKTVKNYSQIEELIDKQKVIGAIIFSNDFSKKIISGKTASVQILFDGRRLNSASIVFGYLQKIINNSVVKKTARKTESEITPISFNPIQSQVVNRNWFNSNLNYKWFIIPSLMGLILSTSILSVSALSIARERELGTFDQLIVSPLSPFEIILGKIGANMLIGMVQGLIIFSIISFFIPFQGNLIFMFLGIFIYLISMVSIGLFISSMSDNQQQATLGSFFFLIPIILTSGFSSPFFNMPKWLQTISDCINPIHHFVTITQMVFNKGLTFDLLKYNFSMLLLMSIVTLFLANWFFKRRVL